MKDRLIASVVLLVTFVVAFLGTTIVCDTVDQHSGYYAEGRAESAEVGK